MQLLASVRAKGALGFAERVGTIGHRFGLTARPMESRLARFAAVTAEAGVVPTFATTAVVLGRHVDTLRDLAAGGIDLAVHGLVHNDHTQMSAELQRTTVQRAKQVFQQLGVPAGGFRAPYLRANEDTISAVAHAGFEYDSSQAVVFDVLPDELRAQPTSRYARALAFYGAGEGRQVAARPRLQQGIVRIPVSLPDDEIMVDRLHLGAEQQREVWLDMLAVTCARGDLLTVQLHPERFDDCKLALGAVLSASAGRPGSVWTASLLELAQWWQARSLASVSCVTAPDGTVTARVEGDPRLRIELLGAGVSQAEPPRTAVVLRGAPEPVVAIGRGISAETAAFLHEEGFLVREQVDGHGCAVVLDREPVSEAALLAEIAAAPSPVLRLARWPYGRRSAMTISGDIDSLTLGDFARRGPESRHVLRHGCSDVARLPSTSADVPGQRAPVIRA